MTMTGSNNPAAPNAGVRPVAQLSAAFLTQAFVWMFAGLLVTAAVSAVVWTNQEVILDFMFTNSSLWLILFIGQLALVVAIGFLINRISATVALLLFFVYAATMGITVGVITLWYTETSVIGAFLGAAAMFGAAAVYGATTHRNLTSIGGLLFMGLIGIIVASVVNLFIGSEAIGYVISVVGVVIFVGLTAWDVQRIQNGQLAVFTGSMEKAAVLGALHLYLDFINIFLFLLRIFGGRR